jgi:hypothetical protein
MATKFVSNALQGADMSTVQAKSEQISKGMESHLREGEHDFSLVLGGPVYQIFRRTHLTGDHLELVSRRVIGFVLIAWVPLLLLSLKGVILGHAGRVAFFTDVEVHVRFLVALPVLVYAELVVNERITKVVRRFIERRIVADEDVPNFDEAIESACRLRNSVPVEVGLFILVYGLGLWLWHHRIALDAATWYAGAGGRWNLTPAGFWYTFVSIPLAQFVLVRWYYRIFIWFRFLWHVSRLKLNLISSHPDRSGGLAFLGRSSYAFGPLLFAQGAMLAGVVAARVLYMGQSLKSFQLEIAGFIAFFVFAVLVPLMMFSPKLAAAKRKGMAEYGQLAQDYVEDFEKKWIRGGPLPAEETLGSGDIQSLADLGNSYSVVKEMRAIPFGLQDITRLAIATAAPFAPLLLTVFTPEELLQEVVKVLF